jgi:hypothetical protein
MEKTKYVEEMRRVTEQTRKEQKGDTLEEISKYIQDQTAEYSYVRNLCDTEPITKFELETPMKEPAWLLPSLGYVGMDTFEAGATNFLLGVFSVQAAKEWPTKYDEENRFDIWVKAFNNTARAIASYEVEAFFRLLVAMSTTHCGVGDVWAECGVDPIYAPIAEPNPPVKYCAVELIHRMAQIMKNRGEILDTVIVGPEDLADLREYKDTAPLVAKEHFFTPAGKLSFLIGDQSYDVQIVECEDLGKKGKYNINDQTSDFGPFIGQAHKDNSFNDYKITNGNVLDENGNLVKAGETQIYGFSKDVKKYLKMPITYPYTAYWDPYLSRRNQSGYYGWQKMAMGCLSNRCVVMGIIDRSKD